MSEERLTRAEWERLERSGRCARHGHDWNFIKTGLGVPVRIVCDNGCGHPGYAVTPMPERVSESAR